MANSSKQRLLLIDSFGLIFRAYYAFPPTLTASNGEPINAVYGFSSLLLDVLLKFQPTHVIAVFDPGGPIIRQSEFSMYKANRKETEENFLVQVPRVIEVLNSFDIPVAKVDGYEADDVIGTLDNKYAGNWAETIVVTGDQDMFQLVDDDTFVYLAGRRFSESKLFKSQDVIEKWGIRPDQVVDYKALAGDSSDNIPGVKGIGKKTAVTLLQKYGSVDNLYDHVDELKGSVKEKLQESYEIAIKSQQLATIDREVPISFDFNNARFETFSISKVKAIFETFSFKSISKKLDDLADNMGLRKSMGLFDTEQIQEEQFESYTNSVSLESVDSVEIFTEFLNTDKNPLNWSVDRMFVKIQDENFLIPHEKLTSFFEEAITNKTLIITADYKKLFHSLLNKTTIDPLKLKVFDIGFAAFILAGGSATYTLESALNYFEIQYDGSVTEKLAAIRSAYESAMRKFEDLMKLKEVYELEMQVLSTTINMERNGIKLNIEVLKEFEQKMAKLQEKLKAEIFKDVGHEFNINSPRQVGEILFLEKSLPGGRKTKSGQFSTDERSLKKLKMIDPVADNILKFREVDKLLSTYIKALPVYVDNQSMIHAIFDQLGAVSGRFSSKNPNMQNIPQSDSLNINIRDAFTPKEDSLFIAFDYSQQELRILAAFSKEEAMVESFNKDEDVHKLTAAEIFNMPIEQVGKLERQVGKTINFSVIYGISAFGLSERLEIERSLASEFIDKYYERYPKVKEYFEKVKNNARQFSYVETALGRRRVSNMINSDNKAYRAAAERELTNFVIQGTAADIMKLAMAEIDKVIKNYPVKLLLQIHDEFLFEFRASEVNKEVIKFVKDIKDCMLNALDLGVKYQVEAKVGKSWGSLEKLDTK